MNRFDDALRGIFPGADPTGDDLQRAEAVYRSGIRSQDQRHTVQRRSRLMAAATAVLAILVVGMFVTTRPGEVQASLTEIAYAARTVDVSDLADGQYFYTESTATQLQAYSFEDGTQLAYMIDVHRRIWIDPGGGTIIETTRSNPRFESEADERTYYQRGLDVNDSLGETETIAVDQVGHPALERDWPLEPGALADEIRSLPSVRTDTDAADALLSLIAESPVSPQLRGAVVEALGRFDLTVIARDERGATFRSVPTDDDIQVIQFTISSAGDLLKRSVYTIGSDRQLELVFAASYSPTRIVERS